MPANKQIVKDWHFWAGILVGVALTLAALSLLGRLGTNDTAGSAGRAESEFTNGY